MNTKTPCCKLSTLGLILPEPETSCLNIITLPEYVIAQKIANVKPSERYVLLTVGRDESEVVLVTIVVEKRKLGLVKKIMPRKVRGNANTMINDGRSR